MWIYEQTQDGISFLCASNKRFQFRFGLVFKFTCQNVPKTNRSFTMDARVHLDISADEHLPAGAKNPWTTWKALNRLRTQVGRSRVNMLKWGFSNEPETCDCGIRQTMQHLLVCPMMDTACSPQDLTMANDIAIGCARHWEGTI